MNPPNFIIPKSKKNIPPFKIDDSDNQFLSGFLSHPKILYGTYKNIHTLEELKEKIMRADYLLYPCDTLDYKVAFVTSDIGEFFPNYIRVEKFLNLVNKGIISSMDLIEVRYFHSLYPSFVYYCDDLDPQIFYNPIQSFIMEMDGFLVDIVGDYPTEPNKRLAHEVVEYIKFPVELVRRSRTIERIHLRFRKDECYDIPF